MREKKEAQTKRKEGKGSLRREREVRIGRVKFWEKRNGVFGSCSITSLDLKKKGGTAINRTSGETGTPRQTKKRGEKKPIVADIECRTEEFLARAASRKRGGEKNAQLTNSENEPEAMY